MHFIGIIHYVRRGMPFIGIIHYVTEYCVFVVGWRHALGSGWPSNNSKVVVVVVVVVVVFID